MKLKSLILGSIAAAGLSTAGFAADLGVLPSMDVCDNLGLSGLTISSDTNCLQISGEVKYEFNWGNFDGVHAIVPGIKDISVASTAAAPGASVNDWNSKVESWLKFVGTAGSDFGPASVVIKIKDVQHYAAENGVGKIPGKDAPWGGAVAGTGGDHTFGVIFDEAYVQVGDTTVLTAGKRGSIFNKNDDEPLNFTGLFYSEKIDTGVSIGDVKTGGHVIQLWSNVGEGLIAKIGLENLQATGSAAGTLVGVLDYSGAGITAHVSGAATGLLDGVDTASDAYAVHAGFTGSFDQFKLLAALSAGGTSNGAGAYSSFWNGLISGEAKFDMFKVALSAEAVGATDAAGVAAPTGYGFGGSVGANVAEGIEINLGGRYFTNNIVDQAGGYQVAAQLVAALTESVKLSTEIGVYGHGADGAPAPIRAAAYSDFYGAAKVTWAPVGGGFESSLGARVQQNGAYKVTFTAKKAFQ